MKRHKKFSFACDTLAFIALADRVTDGKYGKYIRFIIEKSKSGLDEYRLSVKDGIIEIHATGGAAGGAALNAYLKKYCNFYFGILTKNGTLPEIPPDTDEDITEISAFEYRYAFNYCTFGYSYAFNLWEDWERITDYLILSGYNLVLNPIGNECVWLELLLRFGYTREEAKKYISAPNYLPWQWMMNLSGFKSDYPDSWFDEQRDIAVKFNRKLSSFGISSVMPGYCGAVPDDFCDKYKGENILKQGLWCNSYLRPAILNYDSPLFSEISKAYYEIQDALLCASDMHYYSVDPFHEGGSKEGIDLQDYARAVLGAMKETDGNAVWVMQGWNGNPDRQLLSALKREDVLILNLHADGCPDGGDDFLGYPYIYCVVNNFGGEQAMRGSARRTLELPHAMAMSDSSACLGIGIIPEGVECDEILFDVVSEISVREALRPTDEFLMEYIRSRYGVDSPELTEIFGELFDKVYTDDTVQYQHESGLIASPSPTVDRVCFWAGHSTVQDNTHLMRAAEVMMKYYSACSSREGYVKDLVAILRQYVAGESWRYIYALNEAITERNLGKLRKNAEKLLNLIDIQADVVDCDPHLSLSKYIERATRRGKTKEEKTWLSYVSKLLITFWADSPDGACLNDYSAREYGDMLRCFYKPRWEKYILSAEEAILSGGEISEYDKYLHDMPFMYDDTEYVTPVGDLLSAYRRVREIFLSDSTNK